MAEHTPSITEALQKPALTYEITAVQLCDTGAGPCNGGGRREGGMVPMPSLCHCYHHVIANVGMAANHLAQKVSLQNCPWELR